MSAEAGARQGSSQLRSVEVSRLMGPGDANVYGNVHGGVILRLIDEAGTIMATRYCNNAPNREEQEVCIAALARIEHMDFLLPMHIGEVAELQAEIVYTAPHSLMVVVKVWAENVFRGEKRLTNKARLWYVPVDNTHPDKVLPVPPMTYLSQEAEDWGKAQYEAQKAEREAKKAEELSRPIHTLAGLTNGYEQHTVSASQTCLSVIVGTNDVTFTGSCMGGVLLKLMDECAATACCKHCQGICVTACIQATNFHRKIPKGSLINVHAWLTFSSSRSLEVEVVVEFESRFAHAGAPGREKAVDAFFTFVHLDQTCKVQPVPQLKITTEEESSKFEEGEDRYHEKKQSRIAVKKHSIAMAKLEAEMLSAGLLEK